jgi:hypothetical protein
MRTVRRFLMVAVAGAVLATLTVGFALAQGRHAARLEPRVIDVVRGSGGGLEFFDFAHDGLTLGDRLAVVGPLLDADTGRRVGTSYLDCWVGDRVLLDQSPYVCTSVLKFKDGIITTHGLDPHGVSDVFFSVTGGTGAYEGATGQAEYIDSETQTEIIITLDE